MIGARRPRAGGAGFHAGVVVEAEDRAALERLIRYAARPPFAEVEDDFGFAGGGPGPFEVHDDAAVGGAGEAVALDLETRVV